jgi:hypothetical protein
MIRRDEARACVALAERALAASEEHQQNLAVEELMAGGYQPPRAVAQALGVDLRTARAAVRRWRRREAALWRASLFKVAP